MAKEFVSAEFIQAARKKLGMSMDEFSKRLGRSTTSVYGYVQANRCSSAFKELVLQLLADKANGKLSSEIKALPLPYVPKAKPQRPPSMRDRRVPLHIRVPESKLPEARALLSSLGYDIETN